MADTLKRRFDAIDFAALAREAEAKAAQAKAEAEKRAAQVWNFSWSADDPRPPNFSRGKAFQMMPVRNTYTMALK